jgi:hypothetical protein
MEQLRRLEAGLEEVKRLLLAADSNGAEPPGENKSAGAEGDEYDYTFSPIVEGIPPSKTIVIFGKVKELQVFYSS